MYFLASLLSLAVLSCRDVSALPMPPRLLMKRHDCEDCPPQLEENQTVSFSCTLTPCQPGSFSVGFYRVDNAGVAPIHTNSGLFPDGSSVNVTELEYHDCGKVLTFVASAPLNGTVLQCLAVGYSPDHLLGSIARVIAMKDQDPTDIPFEEPTEELNVEPTVEPTEEPTIGSGCDCPTRCAGAHTDKSSGSLSSLTNGMDLTVTVMIWTLIALLT